MRKLRLCTAIVLTSLLFVVLVACGESNNDDVGNIDFEFHVFSNTGFNDEIGNPEIWMSLTELETHIDEQEINDDAFSRFVSERHTADFLMKNQVVFMTISGGGGDSFVVENIEDNGNINVTQNVGLLLNVEAWVIVIELPKTVNISTFSIVLNRVI